VFLLFFFSLFFGVPESRDEEAEEEEAKAAETVSGVLR
jgi:hypothetical protein